MRKLLSRALIIADTNVIDKEVIEQCIDQSIDLAKNIKTEIVPPVLPENREELLAPTSWQDLKSHEAYYIQQVLNLVDGDKDKAAKIPEISLRSLYRKIE